MQPQLLLFLIFTFAAQATAAPAALTTAGAVTKQVPEAALREELQQELASVLARRGQLKEAEALASTLPPFRHAGVLLIIATQLPEARRAEADKILLDAQTDRALTKDWHKSRLARLLAATHAKLGHFDTAVEMARDVPDTEDRAFAQREVVAELNRAGDVTRARELAGSIEENRRYGTYRQKAGALADVARTLHARGDTEGAATLLAQAELLLPKKPGWSDGRAMVEVAIAAHACGQTEQGRVLLVRAETLAQAIAGSWKVSELANLAAAWRACGDTARAEARLVEAGEFLATLTTLERVPEALALARTQAAAGASGAARSILLATLADVDREMQVPAWQAVRVRTLLAWAELIGDGPLPAK